MRDCKRAVFGVDAEARPGNHEPLRAVPATGGWIIIIRSSLFVVWAVSLVMVAVLGLTK